MANSSKISVTEGSAGSLKNTATNSISEDGITKEIQRTQLNDDTGADILGKTSDAAVTTDITASLLARIRGQLKIFADVWDSTNHSLKVSQKVIINGSFTRPADTTAYAAGDAATDSTSAPTIITFTNCAKANAGSGTIIGATLIDSANQSTKGIFELWVFDTTATPDNDNAVFTPTDGEAATLVGVIPFDVSYVGDATSGAGGNAVYAASILNLPFVTGASSRNLFGLLVVRNAYTPVSGEIFTVRLNIAQD